MVSILATRSALYRNEVYWRSHGSLQNKLTCVVDLEKASNPVSFSSFFITLFSSPSISLTFLSTIFNCHFIMMHNDKNKPLISHNLTYIQYKADFGLLYAVIIGRQKFYLYQSINYILVHFLSPSVCVC